MTRPPIRRAIQCDECRDVFDDPVLYVEHLVETGHCEVPRSLSAKVRAALLDHVTAIMTVDNPADIGEPDPDVH